MVKLSTHCQRLDAVTRLLKLASEDKAMIVNVNSNEAIHFSVLVESENNHKDYKHVHNYAMYSFWSEDENRAQYNEALALLTNNK